MSLLNRKIEYWEHQLLDLGKRNRMINYRESKRSTLKIVEPSLCELFDRLAINEEELTFQRSIDRETDIRVFSILSLLENLSASIPVAIGDIKTDGSVLERQKTLKNLRAKSRLAQEEQGTNILYLSFGFIEWKDGKGASAQWIKSPLILVPTVLALEALNSPYTLKKHEDDIVVNPTLEYYLKTEYGIELPQFDADKDNINDYLKSLEEIADQRGWRILKEVSLGLLSFLKISMYNDLKRNEERIKKNPVIRAMTGDSVEVNEIHDRLRNFDLDSISTQDCYQVMSADSSQQDAILYSKYNISFVMQGPPGTGKSQTITNIIAEALAEGKKVLFVSEKMAALQVVYRRLQEAHLGDFCLPLHSYKANKKEILEQIGANLKLKQTRVKDEAISNLEELLAIRQELNNYASELHTLNLELNVSCYEIYSKLEKVKDAPTISFVLDNPMGISQAQLQSFLSRLKEYSLSINRLNCFINDNPWDGLAARSSDYEYSEKMSYELKILNISLLSIIDRLKNLDGCLPFIDVICYDSIPKFVELIDRICAMPDVPDRWLADINLLEAVAAAEEAKRQYSKLYSLREEINKIFNKDIYEYDYNNWKNKLLVDANGFVGMPLISENSPDYYVKNATVLSDIFTSIRNHLYEANNVFVSINNTLGTNFTINTNNQQIIAELLNLLRDNIVLNKNWFSSDIKKIKTLTIEAKSIAEEIKSNKEKILNEWEPEIFSLDYAPILLRYKTDYTSIFKVFNLKYSKDKKQIKALSRGVIKKLSDDSAVNLLNSLKIHSEKTAWFNEKEEDLSAMLGDYYKGIDSNWDLILNAITISEKITKMPLGIIPEKLVDFVAADHKAQTDVLKSMIKTVNASLAKVKELADGNNIEFDVGLSDFDFAATYALINTYIEKFAQVSAQKDSIKPYLNNEDEQLDAIYLAIEQLERFKKIEKILAEEGRKTISEKPKNV